MEKESKVEKGKQNISKEVVATFCDRAGGRVNRGWDGRENSKKIRRKYFRIFVEGGSKSGGGREERDEI